MSRLPQARKDAILSKMLAPHPPTIRNVIYTTHAIESVYRQFIKLIKMAF